MRHRGEDVEAVAAFGCKRWIGCRGPVEVEAEVLGEVFPLEDVVQQSLVARPHEDGVVADLRIAPAGAEIPDEQAHGIARGGKTPVAPAFARFRLQQLAVGRRRIGIGHDDVGCDGLTTGQPQARGAAILAEDFADLGLIAECSALPCDESGKAPDDGACAAHGPVHAEAPFEIGDEAVDRRDLEGMPADEQRMEAQRHAELRVLHPRRHMAMDGAPCAEFHQVGRDAEHVEGRAEGQVAKLLEADPVDRLALAHEAVVAVKVIGRHPARPHPASVPGRYCR